MEANKIQNYFMSPTKSSSATLHQNGDLNVIISSTAKVFSPALTDANANSTSIGKSTSFNADAKKIISTMESVIHDTKKRKRKRKHHSHNIKNDLGDIADISKTLSTSLSIVSPNVSLENSIVIVSPVKRVTDQGKHKIVNNLFKSPLKERPKLKISTEESSNGAGKRNKYSKLSIKNKTKPKLLENVSSNLVNGSTEIEPDNFTKGRRRSGRCSSSTDKKSLNKPFVRTNEMVNLSTSKPNAFDVMMNARNRVIGSNSEGTELDPYSNPEERVVKEKAAKRKIALSEWASAKGGAKRKSEEEAREEYVDNQLKKRAKRFKKMLTKTIPKSTTKTIKSTAKSNRISKNSEESTDVLSEEVKIIESETLEAVVKADDAIIIGRKKTRKKARNALASSESSVQIDPNPNSEEFLKKLSSPIKKRDSLLGYFNKVSNNEEIGEVLSSAEEIQEIIVKNRKKRTYRKRNAVPDKLEIINIPESPKSSTPSKIENESISTTNGRPRRSCVGKARYDYDLSPTKSPIKFTKIKISDTQPLNESKNQSGEFIDLDGSNEESDTPKKLAPVFVKPVPKPAVDPEIVKAKQNFLMSGIPEKMRNEIAKQKQFEEAYEAAVEIFPTISHVLQIDANEQRFSNQINSNIDWKSLGIKMNDSAIETTDYKKIGKFKIFNETNKLNTEKFNREKFTTPLPDVENKRLLIKHLKTLYAKFPTYKCYNQLREKHRIFLSNDREQGTEIVTDSIVVTKRTRACENSEIKRKTVTDETDLEKQDKPPAGALNGELLFTEKYKPMCVEQVLVNIQPVNQLREFLSLWQNEKGTKVAMNNTQNSFEDSFESNSNLGSTCNFMVLYGPESSGKTNAVFALANEMNFNVLEVNAGMKRTGKKVLQELQEATQSHLVKIKDSKVQNLLKASFNAIPTANGKHKNANDLNDSSSSSETSSGTKLSLILLEDADIVFEQDAGFIEAIHQLAATSKRPVIFTSNNRNCQHLLKLTNQNSIEFPTQNPINISKFLSVLSLVENCPIEMENFNDLYLLNGKNLRKTILEMQFFIQSGGDRLKMTQPNGTLASVKNLSNDIFKSNEEKQMQETVKNTYKHKNLFNFYAKKVNFYGNLPFPIDYNVLSANIGEFLIEFNRNQTLKLSPNRKTKHKSKNLCRDKQNEIEIDGLVQLKEFHNNLSIAVNISDNKCNNIDRITNNLQDEIAYYLVETAAIVNLKNDLKDYDVVRTPKRICTNNLSDLLGIFPTKRSIALDYEPYLRSISRSEKTRAQFERRGTRFYHYLRNTCIGLSSFSTAIFDEASTIFEEMEELMVVID